MGSMKKTLLAVLLGALLPASLAGRIGHPYASPNCAFVTFGDSLTDTGNLYHATGGCYPPARYYFKGRSTNAPGVWVDRLPEFDPSLQVVNFAWAGATACDYSQYLPEGVGSIPSLAQQVEMYLSKREKDDHLRQRLAGKQLTPTIWIGHNDILEAGPVLPPELLPSLPNNTVACILNAAKTLLNAGHTQLVVGALGPVDLSPKIVASGQSGMVREVVSGINAALRAGVEALRAQHEGCGILFWDVGADTAHIMKHPRRYGFKHGSETSCLSDPDAAPLSRKLTAFTAAICKSPNDYVFYDGQHPSARAHALVAKSFVQHVTSSAMTTSARRLVVEAFR